MITGNDSKPTITDLDKNNILINIKNRVEESILYDYNNYSKMIYFGMFDDLQNSLDDIIFSELYTVTDIKYTDWCSNFTFSLSKLIITTMNSLYNCSKIIYFTETDLIEYIYEIIEFNINEI